MKPEIQTLTVEMDPEKIRPAPAVLELAPREDIPSRAFTRSRAPRLNWEALAVIAADAVLWILIVLVILMIASPELLAGVSEWVGEVLP
jgi:hypothetical protein